MHTVKLFYLQRFQLSRVSRYSGWIFKNISNKLQFHGNIMVATSLLNKRANYFDRYAISVHGKFQKNIVFSCIISRYMQWPKRIPKRACYKLPCMHDDGAIAVDYDDSIFLRWNFHSFPVLAVWKASENNDLSIILIGNRTMTTAAAEHVLIQPISAERKTFLRLPRFFFFVLFLPSEAVRPSSRLNDFRTRERQPSSIIVMLYT